MNEESTDLRLKALEDLFANHASEVYRFALRLSGDRDEAEDLAADAFAQAASGFSQFRGEASPRTWLCAIVLNRFKMLRRRDRMQRDFAKTVATTATTFPEDGLDLADAVAGLPEHLREAFLLVKGEGFTHAEAAQATGAPLGTVYSRVFEAVKRVRQALRPNGVPPMPASEVSYEREM
jgi:RNA polymerase sigma-70 factor (ECF subfamily)